MNSEVFKLIANWQSLIQEKGNEKHLKMLFSTANHLSFSKVSFAEHPCFKNDLVTFHLGLSDDKSTLYGILLRASQNNLDAIFQKETLIYVAAFKENLDKEKKPAKKALKPPYKYEQLTTEEAEERITAWQKNKMDWMKNSMDALPRYALIPSADFDQTADYTLSLALKPFMKESAQLDVVVRNMSTSVYADAVRVVPPCRPRPFWWD